ncbi:energy transducer TonB [Pseudoalteromonas sp. NBT06-2]|uniref:energy transducer TonB n=1 Tax=Pseudoalteromonas sp. NBT06-2 TaxID=2025950 RepID=UPI000BA703E8|nr:energy transducer TonB [Pseudoalteromonas sp. NBT06-2]PAJ73057.1 energy transducer TonB [Pseudoalteromonas sp. NBT06-2]
MKSNIRLLLITLSLCSTRILADFSSANKDLQNNNFAAAAKEFTKLAQRGHSNAQFELAQLYEQGLGVEKNITTAYAWYLIAVDFKHPEAKEKYRSLRRNIPSRKEGKNAYLLLKNKYGNQKHKLLYEPDLKRTQFYPERAKLIKKVEPQYPPSLVALNSAWVSISYNVDESGHVEDARVLASFPKGALDEYALEAVNQWQYKPQVKRNGEPNRVHDLIITFKNKSNKSKNHKQYKKQLAQYTNKLKALAIKGNSYAQARYALMLEQEVIESTNGEHINWYYKAAINGNYDAQLRLVHCFENGEGCQPSRDKAFAWLVRASETQNARAQFQLAITYLNYESIHYDVTKAAALLKLATLHEYFPAMVEYSKLLAFSDESGIRDISSAIKYAELARSLDATNPTLLSVLGAAYSEMGRIQQGDELIRQAYDEAKKRNWPTENYLNLMEGGEAAMMASGASLRLNN